MQLTPRSLLTLSISLLALSIFLSFLGSIETVKIIEREKTINVDETSYYTLTLLLQEGIVAEARSVNLSFTNEGINPVEIEVFSNESLLYYFSLYPGESKLFRLDGTSIQYSVIKLSSNGTIVKTVLLLEIPTMPYTGFSILSLIVLIIGTVLLIQYVAVKIALKTEK